MYRESIPAWRWMKCAGPNTTRISSNRVTGGQQFFDAAAALSVGPSGAVRFHGAAAIRHQEFTEGEII